jgi:hypothetical protein
MKSSILPVIFLQIRIYFIAGEFHISLEESSEENFSFFEDAVTFLGKQGIMWASVKEKFNEQSAKSQLHYFRNTQYCLEH